MDPGANEWKPSASAATWTPGGGQTFSVPAPTSRPAAPTSRPEAPTSRPAAPTSRPVAPAPPAKEEDPDDDIDENDPIWVAVLKIANGDRAAAIKMINDPDSLTKYPEINKILMAGGGDDSMETDEVENKEEVQQTTSADDNLAKEMDTKMQIDDKTSQADQKVEAEVDTASMEEDVEDVVAVKEGDPREHLNLVFIGHVDAGKSTLSGSILYILDYVDKRTIERYEKEAKERNRESWFLAFIMDTNEEERAKGKTVEVGKAHFETEAKRYTILDAPGHKNYVPNMIMGAALADVAGLVISARKGEFEAGFEKDGQTREHAQLAKSLGVQKLIVVVNKMDDCKWSKARYDEIQTGLKPFLKATGYGDDDILWIPVSGLTGANLKDSLDGKTCNWYQGPTFLELIDQVTLQERHPTGPLRIPVLDKMKETYVIAHGKVENGTINLGDKLAIMPSGAPAQVLGLLDAKGRPVQYAKPGENVQVKLNVADDDQIQRGYVLCHRDSMMPVTDLFEAEVDILDLVEYKPIISKGYTCMMHIHTHQDEIIIKDIVRSIEKNDKGEETVKEKPQFAKSQTRIICRIQPCKPLSLEKFETIQQMGRFTLRDEGKTICVGKILKYKPYNKAVASATAVAQVTKQLDNTQINSSSTAGPQELIYDPETGETKPKEQLGDAINQDEEAD